MLKCQVVYLYIQRQLETRADRIGNLYKSDAISFIHKSHNLPKPIVRVLLKQMEDEKLLKSAGKLHYHIINNGQNDLINDVSKMYKEAKLW